MSTPNTGRARAFSFASMMGLGARAEGDPPPKDKDDKDDEEARKAKRAEEDKRREDEDARRAEEDKQREEEDARRAEEDGDSDKKKDATGKKSKADDDDETDESDDTDDMKKGRHAERARWAKTLSSPVVASSTSRLAAACTLLADSALPSATVLKTVSSYPEASTGRQSLHARQASAPRVPVIGGDGGKPGADNFGAQVAAAVSKARPPVAG